MEILVATGNVHKKEEIGRMLDPHRVIMPEDLDISFHAEETGTDYLENALIKARVLGEAAKGRVILADDSGLAVSALGGAPGVFSARYGNEEAGRQLTAPERNELLLRAMKGIPAAGRGAEFVCCMVLLIDSMRMYCVQETLKGEIAQSPSGSGGFGYDPVFCVGGRSVAQMSAAEKDSISHRGRALHRIKLLLDAVDS